MIGTDNQCLPTTMNCTTYLCIELVLASPFLRRSASSRRPKLKHVPARFFQTIQPDHPYLQSRDSLPCGQIPLWRLCRLRVYQHTSHPQIPGDKGRIAMLHTFRYIIHLALVSKALGESPLCGSLSLHTGPYKASVDYGEEG